MATRSAGPGRSWTWRCRTWTASRSAARLREWTRLPIIVLSAHGDDEAKVRALDEGADDYVTKPFSVPELLARMRVAHPPRRRIGPTGEQVVRAGDVEIDLAPAGRHAVAARRST